MNNIPMRALLYSARFKADTVSGVATVYIEVPAGQSRILYGGSGWFDVAGSDDYVLVDLVMPDEVTIVKTMYDINQPTENQGWYMHDGLISFQPIDDIMIVPGGLKLRIRGFKTGLGSGTLRGNIIWGLP